MLYTRQRPFSKYTHACMCIYIYIYTFYGRRFCIIYVSVVVKKRKKKKLLTTFRVHVVYSTVSVFFTHSRSSPRLFLTKKIDIYIYICNKVHAAEMNSLFFVKPLKNIQLAFRTNDDDLSESVVGGRKWLR